MSWADTAAALADRWRVIAPDLRGHGDSDRAADGLYLYEAMALDLAALVDDLGPEQPVTLVGHSLGGSIAWRYAAAFPGRVRRLVLIEGLGPSPKLFATQDATPPAERLRRWAAETRAGARREPRPIASIEEGQARVAAAHPRLSPEQARHLAEHGLAALPGGGYRWKHDPRAAFPPFDYDLAMRGALWGAIACPTLLVYGAESWASNPAADGRAAFFPDAEVVLIEGAGHWVQLDRPAAFVAALDTFLGPPPG